MEGKSGVPFIYGAIWEILDQKYSTITGLDSDLFLRCNLFEFTRTREIPTMISWVTKVALAGLLLLALAVCAPVGKLKIQHEKDAPIPSGKSVSLQMELAPPPNTSARRAKEFRIISERLQAALSDRLVSEGVFQQVLQSPDSGDYRMQVTLTKANMVAQWVRIIGGSFAGKNLLRAEVQLFEANTGSANTDSLVTSFQVRGQSPASTLLTDAGLNDAIGIAVGKIILALQ